MKTICIIFLILFLSFTDVFSQSLPENAILKNYKPFNTPRTNGRPGEVYRISENGTKYIVQDMASIGEKVSEEGDLIGRMYFTSDELLSLLNLEFDRLDVIPAEVQIVKARREYNEQADIDKILYDKEKIKEIVVDSRSRYFIIREAILSKDITFRFTHEVVKKIKRGSSSLTEIKSEKELDFPFEIQKKFRTEKRIFYLDQEISMDPYDI